MIKIIHVYICIMILSTAIVIGGRLARPDSGEKAIYLQVKSVREQIDTMSIFIKRLDKYVKNYLIGEVSLPEEDLLGKEDAP